MSSLVSAIIVRIDTNEFNVIDVDENTCVADLMQGHFIAMPCTSLHAVQRDAQGRVIGTRQMGPDESVADYVSKIPINDGECPQLGSGDQVNMGQAECFAECHLWTVNATVRVFFNPYIRMVLGLSTWYLDLPVDATTTTLDLELFVKECLGLKLEDARFTLYGNYRSHVSIVEPSVLVTETATREDDANNPKFWQFMMRPEAEDQSHLGIARQSVLWMQEPGTILSGKRYWCALQGTTLFYFRESGDLDSRKAIEDLDHCQILYRGGDRAKKSFGFDIVTPDGHTYRCQSPSKRRIEKWVRLLKRCHRSVEINEPITMEVLAKLTAPQVPPIEPPLPRIVISGGEYQRDYALADGCQADNFTTTAHDEEEDPIGALQSSHDQIRAEAKAFCSRSKLRPSEVLTWSEHVRAFIIDVLRVERPSHIFNVIPVVKALIEDLQTFVEGATARGDFAMTAACAGTHTEAILEHVKKLMHLYQDAQRAGPDEEDERMLNEFETYRRHQRMLQRLKRALRQPIGRINLRNLRIKKNATAIIEGARSSRPESINQQTLALEAMARQGPISHRDSSRLGVADLEIAHHGVGRRREGKLNELLDEEMSLGSPVKNRIKHQERRSVGEFFLDFLFPKTIKDPSKSAPDLLSEEDLADEGDRSERRARIPETEVQELSMPNSPQVNSGQTTGRDTDIEPLPGLSSPSLALVAERSDQERDAEGQLAEPETPQTPSNLWSMLGLGNSPRPTNSRLCGARLHSRQLSLTKSDASSITNAADDEMEESLLKFRRTAGRKSKPEGKPVEITDGASMPATTTDQSSLRDSDPQLTPVPLPPTLPPVGSTPTTIIDETRTAPPNGSPLATDDLEPRTTTAGGGQCQPTPLQWSVIVSRGGESPKEEEETGRASDSNCPIHPSQQTGRTESKNSSSKARLFGHRKFLSMRPSTQAVSPVNERAVQENDDDDDGAGVERSSSTRTKDVAGSRPLPRVVTKNHQPPMVTHRQSCQREASASDHNRRKSVVEIDQILLNALLKDPRLAKLIHPATAALTEVEASPIAPPDNTAAEESISPAATTPKKAPAPAIVCSNAPARPSPGGTSMGNRRTHARHQSHIMQSSAQINYLGNCEVCQSRIEQVADALQTPFAAFHRACLVCDHCGRQLTTQSFRLERGAARCRMSCQGDDNRGRDRHGSQAPLRRGPPLTTSTTQVPLKSILKKPPSFAA